MMTVGMSAVGAYAYYACIFAFRKQSLTKEAVCHKYLVRPKRLDFNKVIIRVADDVALSAGGPQSYITTISACCMKVRLPMSHVSLLNLKIAQWVLHSSC